jgi:hypothetical protein
MTTSKTIAGLIGPTLVAIAAGMLLNIGSFPALAEQVSRDSALIFVSGILLFVAGLAIDLRDRPEEIGLAVERFIPKICHRRQMPE